MFTRHFFAPIFAVSLAAALGSLAGSLAGCAAQSAHDSDDDPSTMRSEDALSAFGKLLVGSYRSEAFYPRFTLAADGTYRWDSGIRCITTPCPSGDVGRFFIYRGVFSGVRYVNLRSSDGSVERWLRVDSLTPTKLVGVFGTTGVFTRDTGKDEAGCKLNSDCAGGEQCDAGTCVARPLCVQIQVTDGRYVAKNFPAGSWAEANAWADTTAAGAGHGISLATCAQVAAGLACTEEYAPLCTMIGGSDFAYNESNLCYVRRAVLSAAGEFGEVTGVYTKGECEKGELRCATYWLKSDPAAVEGAYYAHTFASEFEASSWIALQPSAVDAAVLPGACDAITACTKEYNPVCGGVRSDEPSTFGNRCMFMAAVRASSTTDGWSKGYVSAAGECTK